PVAINDIRNIRLAFAPWGIRAVPERPKVDILIPAIVEDYVVKKVLYLFWWAKSFLDYFRNFLTDFFESLREMLEKISKILRGIKEMISRKGDDLNPVILTPLWRGKNLSRKRSFAYAQDDVIGPVMTKNNKPNDYVGATVALSSSPVNSNSLNDLAWLTYFERKPEKARGLIEQALQAKDPDALVFIREHKDQYPRLNAFIDQMETGMVFGNKKEETAVKMKGGVSVGQFLQPSKGPINAPSIRPIFNTPEFSYEDVQELLTIVRSKNSNAKQTGKKGTATISSGPAGSPVRRDKRPVLRIMEGMGTATTDRSSANSKQITRAGPGRGQQSSPVRGPGNTSRSLPAFSLLENSIFIFINSIYEHIHKKIRTAIKNGGTHIFFAARKEFS
ncbi:MAG: hypothetical protein KAS66_16205, partial [Candidatus Omnitrophica bacterium]|nr:hypothetical protein [Candidatus Omnitrophota bacterium]